MYSIWLWCVLWPNEECVLMWLGGTLKCIRNRFTGWLAESRFRGYPEYINDFHEWKTHFLCPVVQCIRTVLPIIQFIAGMIY